MADAYIGEIRMVGFTYAPQYWTNADGQVLDIASHQALFSLYGTTYGGDGRSNFNLPDFRGRMPIHEGHGPGLPNYNMGDMGGFPTVALQEAQMPAHTHGANVKAKAAQGTEGAPTDHYWAQLARGAVAYSTDHDVVMAHDAVEIQSTGGGLEHENRPPYLTIRFCVCLDGQYPPRP